MTFYRSGDLLGIKSNNDRYKTVENPEHLYNLLLSCWCKETCAPRMQDRWSKDNITLGQCSITSFLIQDIFGGEVYGVKLNDGNYHCFNYINGKIFDLTSEQFLGEKLDYSLTYPQSRDVHFSKIEKFKRYLLLKEKLEERLNK